MRYDFTSRSWSTGYMCEDHRGFEYRINRFPVVCILQASKSAATRPERVWNGDLLRSGLLYDIV